MKIRKSVCISVAALATIASSVVACAAGSDEPQEAASSSAASAIVQQAGVKRFRAQVTGNVVQVALLDEAGNGVGSLELTTEAPHRVHAKQTVFGRVLEASWSDDGLTFTRAGKAALTVHAGETRSADADQVLLDATDDLNVALGLARDVGAFSLVARESGGAVKTLTLGTGEDDRDRFTGTNWSWGTGSSSWTTAYNASQNTAYSGCAAVHSSGCATYQGATMSTSCSTGSYYTSCSTTVTVGACASTGTCPR